MPRTSVYFVIPFSSARTAASLIRCGVSKSGSPAANVTRSMPCAFMACAFAVTASVTDGLIALLRSLNFIRRISLGSLFELFFQLLQDVSWNDIRNISAQAHHLFDQARTDVEKGLPCHHKQGLKTRLQM